MANHAVDWRTIPPAQLQGGALAIGNFDGVHRGHAALVAELRTRARAVGGPAVALTFDPHPLQLLRPEGMSPPLTAAAERARLLGEIGADYVWTLHTTRDLLALAADEFFAEVVRQRFAARVVVEGPDFGFGHNREGTIETLNRLGAAAGIAVTVVPPLVVDGAEVSSSRVRSALIGGDVVAAAELLGRPYRLSGTVAAGQRRGQKLGFPTANLDRPLTLVPGDGVYAVGAWLADGGAAWPAAANVGANPTFGEAERKVEVHLIGFQGDLYGQTLAVDFLRRLRDTRPFANVGELVEQLRRDVQQAEQLVAESASDAQL